MNRNRILKNDTLIALVGGFAFFIMFGLVAMRFYSHFSALYRHEDFHERLTIKAMDLFTQRTGLCDPEACSPVDLVYYRTIFYERPTDQFLIPQEYIDRYKLHVGSKIEFGVKHIFLDDDQITTCRPIKP